MRAGIARTAVVDGKRVTEIKTLMLVLVVHQALYALGWVVAGLRFDIARAIAMHWMGFGLAGAVAVGLFLGTLGLSEEAAIYLRIAGVVLAAGLLRRGTALFLQLPTRDVEQISSFALCMGLALYFGAGTDGLFGRTIAVSAAIGWVLLRLSFEELPAIAREFGRTTAVIIALPAAFIGTTFAVRAVVVLLMGEGSTGVHIMDSTRFNTAIIVALVVMSALFNFSLVYLVVMRMVNRLRYLSQRDVLTGLLNRRSLDELLTKEMHRFRRTQRPLSLLLVDIDHFKRINDSYGHTTGDLALVRTAQILSRTARAADTVARIGGEEFCVVLPDTSEEGALIAADRVRATFESEPLGIEAHDFTITVSVGAACFHFTDTSPASVFERADVALYRAKSEGRNRVSFSGVGPLRQRGKSA